MKQMMTTTPDFLGVPARTNRELQEEMETQEDGLKDFYHMISPLQRSSSSTGGFVFSFNRKDHFLINGGSFLHTERFNDLSKFVYLVGDMNE